jgi:osmotically-inducible protein OsmY
MNSIKLISAAALALLILAGCNRSDTTGSGAPSDEPSTTAGYGTNAADHTTSSSATEADNSGRNVRDRSDATLTPGDQGTTEADRETTRKIRRAITANDQLSISAKNIKIITTDGKVTLRGPVNSTQELQTVQSIIQQLGIASVDNQLEVKTTNQ